MKKIYPADAAKIAANRATAGARQAWNERVDREKEERAYLNREFVPRKASHKRA